MYIFYDSVTIIRSTDKWKEEDLKVAISGCSLLKTS